MKSVTVFKKQQGSERFQRFHWPRRRTRCTCGLACPSLGATGTQSSPSNARNLTSVAKREPHIPGHPLLPQRTASRLHPFTYVQHRPQEYHEPESNLETSSANTQALGASTPSAVLSSSQPSMTSDVSMGRLVNLSETLFLHLQTRDGSMVGSSLLYKAVVRTEMPKRGLTHMLNK